MRSVESQQLSLISVDEFVNLAREKAINAVIDSRQIEDVEFTGVMPGAVHVPWESWNEPAPPNAKPALHELGYWGKLADPHSEGFAGKFAALGIANDSHVVIYADGMRSKGREGRLAWMLLYFGVKKVSILNGGWRAWRAWSEANPHFAPAIAPDDSGFTISTDERRRAYLEQVQEAHRKGDVTLVDTRSKREFNGAIYDYQPRLGRIPGAVNFPFRAVLHANGLFISRDEYMELLAATPIGAKSIWYCEVGVRAAAGALLHEIYTGEIVPVYDASFMEWSLDLALPVAALA